MEEIIKYYINLLILQYRNKPKAKATIESLAKVLFEDINGEVFLLKFQNAFDLDTAELEQLKALSKYIGYSDSLNVIDTNYFRLSDYEGDDETPGLSDYNEQYIGYPLLTYSGYTYIIKSLSGSVGIVFFRKILKFLSEIKNKILSLGNLSILLYKYFGNDIYVEEGDKSITYVYSDSIYQQFNSDAILFEAFVKKYMPRPIGCTMTVVKAPFYLNLQAIGGAENYIDENFIYTRDSSSSAMFFKTFNGFNVGANQKFEIQMKVKIDASYTSTNDWCYTAIDGDNEDFDKKYDFGLAKRSLTNSFAMINKNNQGQVQYIDLLSYIGYTDTWVTINLKKDVSDGSIIATMSVEGTQVQQVDSHWGMAQLENAYFIFGEQLVGSIDFKECWIKQDNVITWKGITEKKPKGV